MRQTDKKNFLFIQESKIEDYNRIDISLSLFELINNTLLSSQIAQLRLDFKKLITKACNNYIRNDSTGFSLGVLLLAIREGKLSSFRGFRRDS